MIIIHATTRIAPESREAFLAAARATIADSLKEDGCVTYSLSEDITEPGAFNWIEVWRDLDAFNDHVNAEHHLELLRQLAGPIQRSGPAHGTTFEARVVDTEEQRRMGFAEASAVGYVPAGA